MNKPIFYGISICDACSAMTLDEYAGVVDVDGLAACGIVRGNGLGESSRCDGTIKPFGWFEVHTDEVRPGTANRRALDAARDVRDLLQRGYGEDREPKHELEEKLAELDNALMSLEEEG